MKKKVLSVFLLFSLIAPIGISFIVLQYQKKQVKRELKWRMISGIDKDELVFLKFSETEKKTQLNWKHAKEFEYNGEMYDIVQSETIGDTTYYWLWWDHKETHLNRKLNELLHLALGTNPQNKETGKKLNKFLSSLYYEDIGNGRFTLFSVSKGKYFFTNENSASMHFSPPVPPPQFT